ncbi:MAG: PAS domain S-box protein [Bacteroidetes bacterium]|nr:MAG: PAS domain S-box protein [Bacteroidota bacterium]
MKDQDKTRSQLIDELKSLRKSLAEQHQQGDAFRREVQEGKDRKNQLEVPNKQLQIGLSKSRDAQQVLLETKKQVDAQRVELDHLYEISPVGLCLIDRELRFVRINEHMAGINGKPASEHIGRTLSEIIPEIAVEVEPIYRRVIDTGQPECDFEIHGMTAAEPEKPKDWLVSYFPLKSNDGTVQGVSTVVQEITDRKRFEKAWEESEGKFRAICENAPVMINSFDYNRRCLFVNNEFEKNLHWTLKEFMASDDPLSLVYPDSKMRDRVLESIDRADGVFHEYPVLAKDGSVRVQMWANYRLPDNSAISVGYDITDRKRVENALRQSEERYRTLTEAAQDAIFIIDREDNIVFVNSFAAGLFGKTPPDLIGGSRTKMFPPEVAESQYESLQKVFKSGEPLQTDAKSVFRKHDIWMSTRLVPMKTDSGEVHAVLGISRDITEHKQAEKALRQYEHIVSSSQDLLALIDKDFFYLAANDSYLNAFGITRNKLINHSVSEMFGKEIFKKRIKPNAEKCLSGEEVCYEHWVDFPASGKKYMEVNYYPYKNENDETIGFVVNARDITDRKQAEEKIALQASMLEQVHNAIITIDFDNRILSWSKHAEVLYQWKSEEAIGKNIIELLSPEEMKSTVEKNIGYLNREGHWEGEFDVLRKDGTTIPAHIVNTYMKDINGKNIGFIGISNDITERKKAEHQMEALLKEKELLLREIQHRVKNNFQVICSLIDLQVAHITDKKVLEAFGRCQSQIRSIALIHDQLYQSSDLTTINLNEYVRKLTGNLLRSPQFNSDVVQIKLNLDEFSLSIGKAVACGLIINELVVNALKYAFPEGRSGEIHVEFRKVTDDQKILIVSDNGVGLPEGWNFENTESWGLELVQILTEQLDGKIELDQKGGTTFKMTLNFKE